MANFTTTSPFGFAIAEQLGTLDSSIYSAEEGFFAEALVEARKGIGRTRPNPPVGAVVVRMGQVVGRGFTAPAGGPHAEINALREAGEQSYGATLYVTLEPCSHYGRTPPCIEAIRRSQIARVVVGVTDPNPLVNGQGIAAMRAAGVQVDLLQHEGLRQSADALILPFRKSLVRKLPWVLCKVATSLDGRIAKAPGVRTSISGQDAWQLVHRLRNRVDAVAVGANTVLADNPQLNVRGLEGETRNPLRFVIDSSLRTDAGSVVYQSNHEEAYVIHTCEAPSERIAAFDSAGVNRIVSPALDGHVSLEEALKALLQIGVASVLFECGSELLARFVNERLFDELWWMVSPRLLGAAGPSALARDLPADVESAIEWQAPLQLGMDCLYLGRRKN